MENSITIDLVPNREGIESARKKSDNFLRSLGLSDDTVKIQIRILKELIKNGLKYGCSTPTDNKFSIIIEVANKSITLEVMNPVNGMCRDSLEELDRTIQLTRGYQDPFEAYMLMKKRNLANSSQGDYNDLELFKIAYEGNAILDFYINEDNVLNLSAVRSLREA